MLGWFSKPKPGSRKGKTKGFDRRFSIIDELMATPGRDSKEREPTGWGEQDLDNNFGGADTDSLNSWNFTTQTMEPTTFGFEAISSKPTQHQGVLRERSRSRNNISPPQLNPTQHAYVPLQQKAHHPVHVHAQRQQPATAPSPSFSNRPRRWSMDAETGGGDGGGGDDGSEDGEEFDGFEVHWPASPGLDGPTIIDHDDDSTVNGLTARDVHGHVTVDLDEDDNENTFDAEQQQAVWKMMQNNHTNNTNDGDNDDSTDDNDGADANVDDEELGRYNFGRDSGRLMMHPASRTATPVPPTPLQLPLPVPSPAHALRVGAVSPSVLSRQMQPPSQRRSVHQTDHEEGVLPGGEHEHAVEDGVCASGAVPVVVGDANASAASPPPFASSLDNSFVEFKYNQGQGAWWTNDDNSTGGEVGNAGSVGGGGSGSGGVVGSRTSSSLSLGVKYDNGSAWYTKHARDATTVDNAQASAPSNSYAHTPNTHSKLSQPLLTRLGSTNHNQRTNDGGGGGGSSSRDNNRGVGKEGLRAPPQLLEPNHDRSMMVPVPVRSPPQLTLTTTTAPTTTTSPPTAPTSFLGFDLDALGSKPLPALSRGQEQAVSSFISNQLLNF